MTPDYAAGAALSLDLRQNAAALGAVVNAS